MSRSIKDWAIFIHQNAKDHGWWETDRNIGEQIALMHSELSEALEEYRKGSPLDYTYQVGDKPEGFGVELADCVIRIMDTCERYGIDLEAMIKMKHEFNLTRSYKHGGKIA